MELQSQTSQQHDRQETYPSVHQILSDKNLNETYKHIIVHTDTNDLRATKGNLSPLIREVAVRASECFLEAKITLSFTAMK